MTFVHPVRVRYGECDMQRVVFNANYWAYCDDAVDTWVRSSIAGELGLESVRFEITDHDFDFMLKRCTGTWHRPVVFGDTVDIACSVSRWGQTSFDVSVDMRVRGEICFDAIIVYVSVGVLTREAVPVPDFVRRALS